MDSTSYATAYDRAVKRLNKAEATHRQRVGALESALERAEASKVPGLRKDCEKSERELSEALQTAFEAHRAYWVCRRDQLRDEFTDMAVVIAEYNAMARVAGDTSVNPGLQLLQNILITTRSVEPLVEDVPSDPPDSDLLEETRGIWR